MKYFFNQILIWQVFTGINCCFSQDGNSTEVEPEVLGERPVYTIFPTWSYWTEWTDCITRSEYWCMGLYNRTRSCFINEEEIVPWEVLDAMTNDDRIKYFGKDTVCGTDRYFYGWGGLMNGTYESRQEDKCHNRICSKFQNCRSGSEMYHFTP